MTSIGSTNPYYASSVWSVLGKNGNGQGGTNGGDEYPAPKQSQSASAGASISGSDTVFGSKLAGALWSLDSQTTDSQSMESQGVDIDQAPADDTWLGEQPSTATEDEFMELSKKTFAERIREQYLKDNNLTEDDLKSMSPDDRAAVEADIRKAVLEAMGVNGKNQTVAMSMGSGGADAGQTGGQGAGKSADPVAALLGSQPGAAGDDDQFAL